MSYTDNISQRADSPHTALQRKEAADAKISEINSAIKNLEQQLESLYRQLGTEYFKKYNDAPDASLAEFVSEIKTAEQKINDGLSEIEQIKAVIKCKKCGADIATGLGMLFCNQCGTPVFEEKSPPQADSLKCFSCGQSILPDTRFCTGCGMPVADIMQYYSASLKTEGAPRADTAPVPAQAAPVTNTQPPEPPRPEPQQTADVHKIPDAQPAVQVDYSLKNCPVCKSYITSEMIFCTCCGNKLK